MEIRTFLLITLAIFSFINAGGKSEPQVEQWLTHIPEDEWAMIYSQENDLENHKTESNKKSWDELSGEEKNDFKNDYAEKVRTGRLDHMRY